MYASWTCLCATKCVAFITFTWFYTSTRSRRGSTQMKCVYRAEAIFSPKVTSVWSNCEIKALSGFMILSEMSDFGTVVKPLALLHLQNSSADPGKLDIWQWHLFLQLCIFFLTLSLCHSANGFIIFPSQTARSNRAGATPLSRFPFSFSAFEAVIKLKLTSWLSELPYESRELVSYQFNSIKYHSECCWSPLARFTTCHSS